jgi:NAD(P)-dependent dehydrogenase (short-subunit alcohol dehydrogenase family)
MMSNNIPIKISTTRSYASTMPQLVWLITGTSSGFGLYLAQALLSRGDLVIATARNPSKSAELSILSAHKNATVLQLDVTADQDTISTTIAQAAAIHGRIDVLVNNAGFVQVGTFEGLSMDDWNAQFATNFFGVVKTTKAVLPLMRAQSQKGMVVFISSLNGWVGHPGVGAYAASKHALEGMESFSLSYAPLSPNSVSKSLTRCATGTVEALSHEINPLGIRTLLMEPGRFRTKLLSSTNLKAVPSSSFAEYSDRYASIATGIADEDGKQPGDPQKFVDVVIDAVRGEGALKGMKLPLRLPLGNDAWEEIGAKVDGMRRDMDVLEALIRSTDVVGTT